LKEEDVVLQSILPIGLIKLYMIVLTG